MKPVSNNMPNHPLLDTKAIPAKETTDGPKIIVAEKEAPPFFTPESSTDELAHRKLFDFFESEKEKEEKGKDKITLFSDSLIRECLDDSIRFLGLRTQALESLTQEDAYIIILVAYKIIKFKISNQTTNIIPEIDITGLKLNFFNWGRKTLTYQALLNSFLGAAGKAKNNGIDLEHLNIKDAEALLKETFKICKSKLKTSSLEI